MELKTSYQSNMNSMISYRAQSRIAGQTIIVPGSAKPMWAKHDYSDWTRKQSHSTNRVS